jgi:hypothetical protein
MDFQFIKFQSFENDTCIIHISQLEMTCIRHEGKFEYYVNSIQVEQGIWQDIVNLISQNTKSIE